MGQVSDNRRQSVSKVEFGVRKAEIEILSILLPSDQPDKSKNPIYFYLLKSFEVDSKAYLSGSVNPINSVNLINHNELPTTDN